jgi:hypothetical protein
MGLKFGEGRYFWRLILWTLVNCPSKFALAVSLTIYGYHFRKVNRINQAKEAIQARKTIQHFKKHPSLEKPVS